MTLAENLTNCSECGVPFAEPVTQWDDYFDCAEDASFWCDKCADHLEDAA